MLRDFAAVLASKLPSLRSAMVASMVALAAVGCGIKGPLKPAPAAPDRPPVSPVPAPNAPAPGQEPPPPIQPRAVPNS